MPEIEIPEEAKDRQERQVGLTIAIKVANCGGGTKVFVTIACIVVIDERVVIAIHKSIGDIVIKIGRAHV